ncbi:dihydropteroate synthase [Hymenobacter ginsengisoli]|uniref:dihydropteroate synthase n=1 Tax=Hymenobacter ginsengisoli TaxID=1051626 RepID=A0ABP8QJK8_9BACT|nr:MULTISPECIES: dihydropteroate synthase [unclassified Hymenobacter]MBO2030238.1 dihydropteroate synthase [Hymenobacter sp. BT559]
MPTHFSHSPIRSFTNSLRSPHGRLLDLRQPQVMGILNVTPDSFYPGSRLGPADEAALLHRAEAMLAAGAAALDVGGYSSRPGADDISPDEEKGRLVPAIAALRREFPEAFISADTFRASVAAEAVAAGADLVNDIGGGTLDAEMFATVARLQVPYCLMHIKGTPQTMRTLAHYDEDIVLTVLRFFRDQLAALRQANGGLAPADVLLDPGFGFAKTPVHNHALLRRLPELAPLGHGLLVGLSRKAMVYKPLGLGPEAALNGTTALHVLALQGGARLLRVHDVAEARQTIALVSAS